MNEDMKKNLILAVVLLVVYVFFFGMLFVGLKYATKLDQPSAIKAEQCQYPNRPLVDGHCDNSDPAVPECIKAQDEKACALEYNRRSYEPEVKILPSVGGSGK